MWFATIVDKINKQKKISTSISDLNSKTSTLNTTTIRENLNYITKFELPPNIAKHIDICLMFHIVHIHDPITASDIKLNS